MSLFQQNLYRGMSMAISKLVRWRGWSRVPKHCKWKPSWMTTTGPCWMCTSNRMWVYKNNSLFYLDFSLNPDRTDFWSNYSDISVNVQHEIPISYKFTRSRSAFKYCSCQLRQWSLKATSTDPSWWSSRTLQGTVSVRSIKWWTLACLIPRWILR